MILSGAEFDLENPITFSDQNNIADYALDAVNALSSAGIIKGSNGAFNPSGIITREQAIVCVIRAKGLIAGNDVWHGYNS
jgi:hypothetical protein